MKNNFLLALSAASLLIVIFSLFNLRLSKKNVDTQILFACSTSEFTGLLEENPNTAFFEGKNNEVPELARTANSSNNILGVAHEERWVEVDLSEQKLRAWEGSNLFLETAVSTGLPWWPTPQGEFRIWIKLRATKMEGGTGEYYYYLPNVPYVMYFGNEEIPNWRGYGLHGTYWHDDFGNPRSHGCVNLPTPIAEKLYYWITPVLPAGKSVVYSSAENPGTRVVIHE